VKPLGRAEWGKGDGPPARFVARLRLAGGEKMYVRAQDFRGKDPWTELAKSKTGTRCFHCSQMIPNKTLTLINSLDWGIALHPWCVESMIEDLKKGCKILIQPEF